MGTDYYHITSAPCPHCGHTDEREVVRIGKSSVGWTFGFHGTDKIRSYADWLTIIDAGGKVMDDCGNYYSPTEFRRIVESKRYADHDRAKEHPDGWSWTDREGYGFSSR